MVKKLILLNILLLLLLSSCCKDREDRTTRLSIIQRSIFNNYKFGDKIYMIENDSIEVSATVTRSGIIMSDDGMFCNKTWDEKGVIFFDSDTSFFQTGHLYELFGNIHSNGESKNDYINIQFTSETYIGTPKLLEKRWVNGIEYSQIYYLLSSNFSGDTLFFTLNEGIIEVITLNDNYKLNTL
ncbi:MAG: hypothetical protein JXR60_07085 [Bacteroidales bacterium]|nr:hypothetical protein [Bacteroidales bacterium]